MTPHRYEIIVTHNRRGLGLSGPRLACKPYTLTNLSASEHTEADAQAELQRCVKEFPQYRLKLMIRTTHNDLVDVETHDEADGTNGAPLPGYAR